MSKLAMISRVGALAVLTLATACTTTKGPEIIVSRTGVVEEGKQKDILRFEDTFKASLQKPDNDPLARAMLIAGMTSAYLNCADFFKGAGESQQWLFTSKDAVALIGTALTGAIGLAGGSTNAIAALALGTTSTVAGIDLYAKHFLFGADNVANVEDLILRKVADHAAKVQKDAGPFDFYSALQHLIDNQRLCEVQNILAAVKQAIKEGKVESGVDLASDLGAINQVTEDTARRDIALAVNDTSNLADDTMAALHQVVTLDVDLTGNDAGKTKARAKLRALNNPPIDATGKRIADWKSRALVRDKFSLFSASARKKFNDDFATLIGVAPAAAPPVAAAPAAAPSAAPAAASVTLAPSAVGEAAVTVPTVARYRRVDSRIAPLNRR